MTSLIFFLTMYLFLIKVNCYSKLDVVRNLTDQLVHINSRLTEPTIKMDNQSNVEVKMMIDLRNIIDFDVSKGILKLFVVLTWSWTDSSLSWDENEYPVYTVRLAKDRIWMPLVYVENTAEGTNALTVGHSVEVSSNGFVSYETPQVIDILCTPDVSKFPFDEHVCGMYFAPLLDNSGFGLTCDGMGLESLWENSMWNVTGVNVKNKALRYVDIHIRLKRNAYFLIVNFVSPVLILGILNLFVFTLPQESGERVSFSITMLLSFVVFLSFTSESLPDNNSTTCIFNVFLLSQLVMSSLITLSVIFLSWLYYLPEERKIPEVAKLIACKRRKQKVCPKKGDPGHDALDEDEESDNNITWIRIAKMMNLFFQILFLVMLVIEYIVTFSLILT